MRHNVIVTGVVVDLEPNIYGEMLFSMVPKKLFIK